MAQSVKQEQKKDNYGRIAKEIAMPSDNELPPVLADNPSDWGGNSQSKQQYQQAEPAQEQYEEVQEVNNDDSGAEQVIDDSADEQEEVQEAPRQKNSSAQESFRMLRERVERAEREKDELMKYVLQSKTTPQPNQPVVEEDNSYQEYDIQVEDDALIEGKHAKRLAQANKKMAQDLREIKQELKRVNSQQNQSNDSIIESQLRQQYPDLDAVVNKDTLDQLKRDYPEIAETIRMNPDLHARGTTAYNVIKKFGIYKDRSFDVAKVNVNKNINKPRPVSSLNPQQGESPLSKANAFANGLTDDLKKQMLKEMNDARKNM